MLTISLDQARQFMLVKQGLIGRHRFAGKDGAYRYVRQAGCIQFDPVDACGRNAELTLQSRVKGFRKQMLEELLKAPNPCRGQLLMTKVTSLYQPGGTRH
ncbi:MAG: hypothetical protein IIY63_00210 [Oscillospiraceae bacterium]|nr:hypothetical protein [Oscillospiraceae bacterium]